MSVLSSLMLLAPDIIAILIGIIADAEKAIKGKGRGPEKKERVMSIVEGVLQIKDFFIEANLERREQIISLISQGVDILVGVFDFKDSFASAKGLDFTPEPRKPDSNTGSASLGAILSVFILSTLLLLLACGPKALTPANEVLYDGPMEGTEEVTFPASDMVVAACYKAKACMGVQEDYPLPHLIALKGGSGVQCQGHLEQACYESGVITIAQNSSLEAITHTCIHHWTEQVTADPDYKHLSEHFRECAH